MIRTPVGQIFISYKHVQPDEGRAASLAEFLRSRGLTVFLDSEIKVGTEWAKELECQLRASKAFVVLLSKDSIPSEMVRQEVKLAHKLRLAGRLRIFPVRLNFQSELPYDLACYLNPIQYVFWSPNHPFDETCEQVFDSICSPPSPVRHDYEEKTDASLLTEDAETSGAPLPAADVRLETGTLAPTSPFYVRRPVDHEVERRVIEEGTTIIIKGPRQVGKSSLLARALKHGRENQGLVFYLDFQLIDAQHFESLGSLFQYLANRMSRTLRTELTPPEVWDDLLGHKYSLTAFIEQALLSKAKEPVILAFDEADRVFRYDYRDDFFATMRGWHNNRAVNDQWKKLNIVITHATEPILWIRDLHQSPFNVGDRFRLTDFSDAEVRELNSRHRSPLNTTAEIEGLIRLVSGHPYLTRQALYWLGTRKMTFKELKRTAADETGPFGDHLRSQLWPLRDNERLRQAIKNILRNGVCSNEDDFQSLLAGGLIRGESRRHVEMRCDLYRDYFGQHL